MSEVIPTDEVVVQRFRPYCCHLHGGHDGQVRLNPKGMYVRWQDYERLRVALQSIISHGDFTAPEGMKRIAREALKSPIDWEKVFTRSFTADCTCYGHEGDDRLCPKHGGKTL